MQTDHRIHRGVENGLHPEMISMLQDDAAHFIERVFDDERAEDPPKDVPDLFPVGRFEWIMAEIDQGHQREVDKGVDEVPDGMGFR